MEKEEREREEERGEEKEREIYGTRSTVYVHVLCTHTRARPTSANLVFARLILRV